MKIPSKPDALNSDIGKQFALYVAALGLVMALVLASFISYQQYQSRLSFLESELEDIVKTSQSSIEQSLWILDTRALGLMTQGFLLNDNIVFAQITDENGKTIVSKGMPGNDNHHAIRKTISLYHQDGSESVFLGQLTIVASKDAAFRGARFSAIVTLVQSVLLMFVVSAGVIYLFWRLVSRHLIVIKQYTRNLKLGTHQNTLTLERPINKRTKNDELASMVDAINFMRDRAEKAYQSTLEGWARALELRDKETEGHSRRVVSLAVDIARKLGLDEEKIKYVYYGALLHDIGKMAIPDAILLKPGSLTPEERAIINQHPTYAFEMLKDIEYLRPALAIPYSHHENWDGSGYPQGLKGEAIPLLARIFAVVDNWDALTTDRPYRKAWSQERTIAYLKEQRGKKFDPLIVDVFINILEESVKHIGQVTVGGVGAAPFDTPKPDVRLSPTEQPARFQYSRGNYLDNVTFHRSGD